MSEEQDFKEEFDRVKNDPEKMNEFMIKKLLVVEAELITKTLKKPLMLSYLKQHPSGHVEVCVAQANNMRDLQMIVMDVMENSSPIGMITFFGQMIMILYERLYTN